MSRSQVMSWVTSAVVHTSMLVVLGSALTAIPVVAPEVPGNRIVVMSSMADVGAPDAAVRDPLQTPPIKLLETPELTEPLQEPQSSSEPVSSTSEQRVASTPQPLELAMSSVKLPDLLPSRRLKRSQSSETGVEGDNRPQRSARSREVSDSDIPLLERRQPDMPKVAQAEPMDVPPLRPPTPAELQPTSSSTARQQSSNSVARTVGTTPIKPARPISNPNPIYPPDAVQQGLEGRVVLSVTIAVSGSVTRVTVAESCGHQSLDQAALDAARRWRFSPATRDGKPVEWMARLPIRFRL